jgi:hypothetical protein
MPASNPNNKQPTCTHLITDAISIMGKDGATEAFLLFVTGLKEHSIANSLRYLSSMNAVKKVNGTWRLTPRKDLRIRELPERAIEDLPRSNNKGFIVYDRYR